MTKANKNLTTLLNEKRNKLDWVNFNFIENLLVFCIMKERSVPKESGVHFRISIDINHNAICLLFKIDRVNDPLIKGAIARPDYMVLYADRGTCICTIIEMKGTQEKNLEHGIEQIKALRDRLREEFRTNVSTKFKIRFQGILLTPFNSQIPIKKIVNEAASGFVILPIQYHHKAELYNYVSKSNKVSERYEHKTHRMAILNEFNFIEGIMAHKALDFRVVDSFYNEHYYAKASREGIFINYVLPDESRYSALAVNNSKIVIGVKETGDKYKNKLIEELNKLRLKESRDYKIVQIT